MIIRVFDDNNSLAGAAASQAAAAIRTAIALRGRARIVAATGASQFAFLEELTAVPSVDWKRVELFHLDEYIGLPMNQPASFCKYLQERLIGKTGITNCHLMKGDANPAEVIQLTTEAILQSPIDVAFVGIGENGHLAFNDPPADFQTEDPYIIVSLDEACRRQQVAEGWFRTIEDVPRQAITMSIQQILRSRTILCIVPETRKAEAVRRCFTGEIGPLAPASALRLHAQAFVMLDSESSRLLDRS